MWTSSNDFVATVSSAGLVTTTGFGTASVGAAVDGLTAAIVITVSPITIQFSVLSQGLPANRAPCGAVVFRRDGTTFYSGRGCVVGSARGWNVAAVDRRTGELLEPVRNFDTWYTGAAAAVAMIDFLNRQPDGTLLLLAVADEGGMNVGRTSGCPSNPAPGSICCRPLDGELERLRRTLEGLGAREIRAYCYWNSYSLIAIKGSGAQASGSARRPTRCRVMSSSSTDPSATLHGVATPGEAIATAQALAWAGNAVPRAVLRCGRRQLHKSDEVQRNSSLAHGINDRYEQRRCDALPTTWSRQWASSRPDRV